MGYIEAGRREGAHLLAGGARVGDKGYYIQPTVFSDVADDMSIWQDEIFGPVQSISKFESYEEVISRANATPYGLAAGVFSENVHVVNQLSRSLQAGTVWVNCFNVYDAAVPFGGYKDSGIGRELSGEAL
eukprot:319566-Chlamydomonas_euryale.AAC.1